MTLNVTWIDRHMWPQVAPNRAYPHGIDIDLSQGASATCETALPYPAKRIGYFMVKCDTCGQNTVVTTAGRADDPRSVKVACRGH
jgi:hypothetical protein